MSLCTKFFLLVISLSCTNIGFVAATSTQTDQSIKKVAILGLGHVGLPTAIIAAESGYIVFGFDIDEQKIKQLNDGNTSIIEPGIEARLTSALKNNNLCISSTLHDADCFLIAVPTPVKENNEADLSYVINAADLIAKQIKPGNLVLLTSNIPIGTTQFIAQRIAKISQLQPEIDFFMAHCPERAITGRLLNEIVNTDRIIGGCSQQASNLAKIFYSRLTRGPIDVTTDKTAEMVKLIEDTSRYVQIAFANQIGQICEDAQIDTYKAIELANKHPKVSILSPGCGVGGQGTATAIHFLIKNFPQDSTQLLTIAHEINDGKPSLVVANIMKQVSRFKETTGKNPSVLALGITFRPDSEVLQSSPALKVVQQLVANQSQLHLFVFDPLAHSEELEQLKIPFTRNLDAAIDQADIIIALVKHKQFISLNKNLFNKQFAFIDSCGLMHEIQKHIE